MSTPNSNPEQLEVYFQLVDTFEQLQGMQADATDLVRPTIDASIAAAEEKLQLAEQDPEIRRALADLGSTAIKSLEQIDALQPAVELGLVEQATLDEQRSEILDNRRTKRAMEFIGRTGLTGVETERIPEESVVTPKAETEPTYPSIDITIEGDGVQIGKKGRYIKLSKAYSKDQRDYSEERKAVLKVLVENAGEEISVRKLWEEAFPDDRPFDKDAMTQVKKWLENLTYRNKPIITHNEKRGLASAYCIQNPNVSISEVATTRPVTRLAPAKQQTEGIEPVAVQIPKEPVVKARDKQPEQEKTIEKIQPTVNFPLGHAESVILAEFLTLTSDILESRGIAIPPGDIADKLREGIDASKMIVELSPYSGDLQKAREATICKVVEYFNDGEVVLEDIKNMSELDNRYKLFEYLFEFDSEDRAYLLDTLAKSVPATEVIAYGGSFSSGEQIVDTRSYRIGPDGEKLGLPNDTQETDSDMEMTEEEVMAELALFDAIRTDDNTSGPEAAEVDAVDEPVAVENGADLELEPSELEVFSQEVRSIIEEVLTKIEEFSLEGSTSRRVQGVDGFGFLTSSFVRNASENHFISRDSKVLQKKDIIILSLLSRYPAAMGLQRSTSKPNRRLVLGIVEEMLRD